MERCVTMNDRPPAMLFLVGLTTLALAGTGQKDYRYLIGQSARMCGTVVDEGLAWPVAFNSRASTHR